MALEVIWLQEVAYPARVDRLLADFIFSEGVLTGFTVSEKSGGANMSVDVAAGKAIVEGDDQANQGKYAVRSTAVENVTGFTAPGSNSRYDIVVLRINDTNAGGSSGDDATVERIAGTAAASPVAPDVPDSAILLATIGPITSSTTSITDEMIADSRSLATLAYDVVDDAQATRIGTSAKTASAIARRDSSGRLRVATPSHDDDAANKKFVDDSVPASSFTTSGSNTYLKWGRVVFAIGTTTGTIPSAYRPAADTLVMAIVGTDSIPMIAKSDGTFRDVSGNAQNLSFTGTWMTS